jgi:hypothetical protein
MTAMSLQLPNPKDVRDLFEDLLGRPVTVGPTDPLLADALKHSLICLYTDDQIKLTSVIAMDLPLTIFAGAALGLMPPGGAQDCVADKEVLPAVAENVREVANIMTGFFHREGGRHTKLHQVFLPGEAPPSDALSYLAALGRRLDLTVEVGGYGSGHLAVTLTE